MMSAIIITRLKGGNYLPGGRDRADKHALLMWLLLFLSVCRYKP
jgi:hypothetical protein